MSFPRLCCRWFLGASIATTATHALAAGDDAVIVAEQCAKDAEQGQRARDTGKLIEAKEKLVRCSADACPPVVRKDCARWVTEVSERLPTVVIAARGMGRQKEAVDLPRAEIVIDGSARALDRQGVEVPIDPGAHTLRASFKGYETKTENVVVNEREKGRRLVITLTAEEDATADRRSSRPVDQRSVRVAPHPVPVASWVLGGVGVVGIGGFAALWTVGMSEVSSLRESCAPYCSDAAIDDARTPLNVARVSLGVGAVALLSAAIVYLVSSPSTSSIEKSR